MARRRYERTFDESITDVFGALVRMLALRRWDPGTRLSEEIRLPRAGCRYVRQTTTALREGKVVDVIRPVAITLHETLHDPPCRVRLRLRWRIHTVAGRSLLTLDLEYRLNQAATLRQVHWRRRLDRHCTRMFHFVAANLDWQQPGESADSTC